MAHSFPTRRSSDLGEFSAIRSLAAPPSRLHRGLQQILIVLRRCLARIALVAVVSQGARDDAGKQIRADTQRCQAGRQPQPRAHRSEEHTSELQSLMLNSYAVFCLKNKQRVN